jgi:Fe-S-cluster containining protein
MNILARLNINGQAISVEKKEGREVSCKRGCAACCRQLIPISAPEAFRLADQVLALDDRTRDQYLGRIDAAESAVEAAGLMQELEAIAGGGTIGDVKALAARYFEKWIDCPFLHEESCLVHAERPLVCRDYLVTTPAELCSSPARNKVRTIPTPPVLSVPLSRPAASLTASALSAQTAAPAKPTAPAVSPAPTAHARMDSATTSMSKSTTTTNHAVRTSDQVKEAQAGLAKAGYYKGKPTGQFNADTKKALKA